MSSSSKGTIAKTLLYVAVPSLVAGYLWYANDQNTEQHGAAEEIEKESSSSTTEFKTQNSNNNNHTQNENSKNKVKSKISENDENNVSSSSSPSSLSSPSSSSSSSESIFQFDCGKSSIIHVGIQQAAKGRGRGLFTKKNILKNEKYLFVRPSLTLLFEPYCQTHCLGCFANLHHVPGRQCEKCNRFAVCRDCDLNFGLFDWHSKGECIRWGNLPKSVTSKQRLDVLWLLVRYRAALDNDIDFKDLSSTENSVEASGEKEPLSMLQKLQANPVDIPQQQLLTFSQLTDLDPSVAKQLIMQLRTNAGSICEGSEKIGMALSGHLGFFNHSCAPNSNAKVVSGFLEVTALRDLVEGEEVTICYVDESAPVQERQAILQGHYQFKCTCQRCREETSTALSSSSPIAASDTAMLSPTSMADSVEWEKVEKPESLTNQSSPSSSSSS